MASIVVVCRVTTHLENLEKSGNSKMEKVREKSGEVKSAEIWLFDYLKLKIPVSQLAVVSYIHAQIICTELSTHQYPHITNSKIFASNEEFTPLWKVVKMVLILSHGNAAVESGFSVKKTYCREYGGKANCGTESCV